MDIHKPAVETWLTKLTIRSLLHETRSLVEISGLAYRLTPNPDLIFDSEQLRNLTLNRSTTGYEEFAVYMNDSASGLILGDWDGR
jgi:hypothetical protein